VVTLGGGLQCKLKGKECPIWFSNPQTHLLEKTK